MHELVDSWIPIYHKDILEVASSNLWLVSEIPDILPSDRNPAAIIIANIYESLLEEVMAVLTEYGFFFVFY